jgi:hypothetical protein
MFFQVDHRLAVDLYHGEVSALFQQVTGEHTRAGSHLQYREGREASKALCDAACDRFILEKVLA